MNLEILMFLLYLLGALCCGVSAVMLARMGAHRTVRRGIRMLGRRLRRTRRNGLRAVPAVLIAAGIFCAGGADCRASAEGGSASDPRGQVLLEMDGTPDGRTGTAVSAVTLRPVRTHILRFGLTGTKCRCGRRISRFSVLRKTRRKQSRAAARRRSRRQGRSRRPAGRKARSQWIRRSLPSGSLTGRIRFPLRWQGGRPVLFQRRLHDSGGGRGGKSGGGKDHAPERFRFRGSA